MQIAIRLDRSQGPGGSGQVTDGLLRRASAAGSSSGSAWNSFIVTIEVALIAMPFTAALGILTAWLLDRQQFPGRRSFEFLAMMSFAIPGTVIGVSYILAFNVPPVSLTGTGTIIAIAFAFRNMPVGIRAGLANLSQIDRSLDEASLTLGAHSFGTLIRVILPMLRPAIVTAMVYSFVRAVTAVSAVIFLVTGHYNLATVYIVGRADIGDYGVAIVYSAMLVIFMLLVLVLIQALVGERRIGRRVEAPPIEAEGMAWYDYMSTPAVEFRAVSKRYGGVTALDSVSLAIERGTLVTLLGPSGCGKTTILRLIAGLEQASDGQILIEGDDVTLLSAAERDVSMVFQSYALFPHMTVLENVCYGLRASGMRRAQSVELAQAKLALVGLAGYGARLPSELSGGQQQRVAVARAIVLEPKVLLFDEPLSNLDAKLRRHVREEIHELQQSLSLTAVYVTHDQQEALAISDRIMVMSMARIAQDGHSARPVRAAKQSLRCGLHRRRQHRAGDDREPPGRDGIGAPRVPVADAAAPRRP